VGGPRVLWTIPAVAVTATESAKWALRAVPDGRGGLIVAWEENRGKRVCCRDTRDLYCQRLDASGARLWGDTDFQLAATAAGEEIEGMVPSMDGGALILWRRGMGTLVVQQLDGERKPMLGPDGWIAAATAAVCDWGPSTCFATDDAASSAVIAWGSPSDGGGSAIRVLRFSRSASAWSAHPVTDAVAEADVHPAAVVWCGAGRWLVLVWTGGDPVRLDGIWLGADGLPAGKRFRVAEEPKGSYLHVEASGDGRGGAWAAWGSVIPDRMERMHRVGVASIERRKDGSARVLRGAGGQARTLAMFIGPTMVAVGNQPEEPATIPSVAWRATALIAGAGPDAAVLARTDGTRMIAAVVRRSEGRLAVGAPVTLGESFYSGFSPVVMPLARGRVALAWADTAAGGYRMAIRRLLVANGRLRDEGGSAAVDGPPGLSPRCGFLVGLDDGAVGMAWSGHYSSDHGGVVAQKVAWR